MPWVDYEGVPPQGEGPQGYGAPTPQPGLSAPFTPDVTTPGFSALAGAQFRQLNPVLSAYNYMSQRAGLTPVPGYDPIPDIRQMDATGGTDFEANHLEMFALSQSPAETRLIASQYIQRQHDLDTAARGGLGGYVLGVAAGTFDPTILVPVGPAYEIFRGGLSVLRSAAALGAVGAVQSGLQESILLGTHPGMTRGEAVRGIASGTILAGMLGGALRYVGGPAERAALEKSFDRNRLEMGNENAGLAPNTLSVDPRAVRSAQPVPTLKIGDQFFTGATHADALDKAIRQFGRDSPELKAFNDAPNPEQSIGVIMERRFLPNVSGDKGAEVLQAAREAAARAPEALAVPEGGPPLARPGGASAADLRTLEDLTLRPTFGVAEFLNKTPYLKTLIGSPVLQGLMSPYLSVRRATADLGETGLEVKGGLRGIAINQGGATSRLVTLHEGVGRAAIVDTIDRAYAKYRGAGDANYIGRQAVKVQGAAERMRGVADRKMSYNEFDKEIYRAMYSGDTHPVPEVQEAAQSLRRDIPNKWLDRANEQREKGREIPGVPKNAKSYVPIVHDKPAIKATRPKVQNGLADWLESEQGKEANLQEQISTEWDNLRKARIEGRKMEGRLATAEKRLGDLESRLSEREGETTAALKRQGTVEARNQEARAALKELRDFVQELRDRGANTQEVRDQIREMEANIAEIEKGSQLIGENDLAAIDRAERDGILTGNMRRVARVASGRAKAPKPPSFWRWLADNGGVKGDDLNIDALAAPGLIRKNGPAWDQVQRKLAGEFPELRARGFGHVEGRPAADFGDEIRNAVQESIAGNEPDWFLAERWNDNDRFVAEWSTLLDRAAHDAGVEFKSINDVADFLKGEHEGMSEADYDAIIRSVEEGTGAPVIRAGADDLRARIGIRQGSIDLFKDSLANAKKLAASAETKGKVAQARSGEAGVASTRNLGRLGILNERARIGQKQRDFLDAMHGKAAQDEQAARTKIEELVNQWEGDTASGAQSALERRAQAESERATKQYMQGGDKGSARLASADKAVESAVRAIKDKRTDLTRDELMDRAGQWIDRILGTPDGRLPYDMDSGGPNIGWTGKDGRAPARGGLAERKVTMPQKLQDELGMLENRASVVLDRFIHTIVPDVLLTERHGDVLMTKAFEDIRSEHSAAVLRAKSEKQIKKLDQAYDESVANLAGIRDRVRHVYGWSDDFFSQNAARVAQGLRKLNTAQDLGAVAFSSAFDQAGALWLGGLQSTLKHAWGPLLRHLTSFGEGGKTEWAHVKDELAAAAIGTESLVGSRWHAWEDIAEPYAPQTKLGRGVSAAVDTAMTATGLSLETDIAKRIAGSVVMHKILEAAEASAKGTATAKQVRQLAASGIDAQMAERIFEDFSRPEGGATFDNGVRLPNTGVWRRGSREAFQSAVARETDMGVITPGQEKPLWMSRPIAASLGQYRSFVAASTERLLLAGLQRRDFQALQGLVAMMGIGFMLTKFYSVLNGRPTPDTAGGWVKEAMSRAGVMGWLEEGNSIASKATGGRADLYRLIGADAPAAKYVNRDVGAAVLGPTYSKLEALGSMGSDVAHWTWTPADTRRLRRFGFLQNHPVLRKLYDAGEAGINQAAGIQ